MCVLSLDNSCLAITRDVRSESPRADPVYVSWRLSVLNFLLAFNYKLARVKSGRPPINEYHSGATSDVERVAAPETRYGTSI